MTKKERKPYLYQEQKEALAKQAKRAHREVFLEQPCTFVFPEGVIPYVYPIQEENNG